MNKIRLSVIIPTFNEKKNIVRLIEKIQGVIPPSHEIIIVDDNSPDGTGAEVKKKYSGNSKIHLINRRQDPSLGKSVLLGIEKARGKIIIGMDADGNHKPDEIPELLNFLSRYDLVISSRFVKGGGMQNRFRYLTSYLMNFFLKIILKSKVCDLTSGFYAVKRETLLKLPIDKIYYGYGDYFFRLIYYAQKRGLLLYELPGYFADRIYGRSKSKLWLMTADYLLTALKLRLA